jgi:2-polyprenyl-3-methyl-5-hydroxy-6-metoxy-1,4-benzoquinol methylase
MVATDPVAVLEAQYRLTLAGEPLQLRILESLTSARNYNDWIASIAYPYLGDDALEIGSGIGEHGTRWLDLGLQRVTLSDASPEMMDMLERRYGSDARVALKSVDLTVPASAEHSAVVAFNVLEHVADDVAALRNAARLVRPGGRVVMFVPAFSWAMSRFDRAIGHYRRYTVPMLERRFEAAGLALVESRYVNAPGLAAWAVGMRLLRLTPREGPVLRAWDRIVIPPTRALESRIKPPFGQSVFGVATTGSPAGPDEPHA